MRMRSERRSEKRMGTQQQTGKPNGTRLTSFYEGLLKMAIGKAQKDKKFSPERYGMIFCPDCNGLGKFTNDNEEIKVCRVCGGFGLIKKEVKNNSHNWTRQKILIPDI